MAYYGVIAIAPSYLMSASANCPSSAQLSGLCRNPVAARIFLHFVEAMRVTPSLPQRGRQSKGGIPVTPLSISPVSKKNVSSTF